MISEGYKSAYQQGYSDAMRDFRKKQNHNKDDNKQTEWIPVSDGNPKESGKYWCTFGGTNLTGVDCYTTESDAKKLFDKPEEYIGWESKNVIAWQPLPAEPYKAESEDK